LEFARQCLDGRLSSSGEDISVAAGVSLFEHVFEDSPHKTWGTIFSGMPHRVFLKCQMYPERWMGAEAFAKVNEAARRYYG
jgi:hypothetical protein